ncbi:MAG: 50S ribosomal protein L17 [Candidatus Margulisbacteria bacterium GWF2_35_9]|nr:MAG: 50S ribosomal protein L17 [Candidatus Margulisbacteria bacterium GWF2_35_9]
MRHRNGNKKLGLPTDQRLALITNGAKSLFTYKQIKTTTLRAKQISRYAERIITKAKKDNVTARREVMKMINDPKVLKIIFNDIAPQYKETPGGYTRIIKYGIRRGDAASVSVLELV